jgi:hypothetical protein
MAAVLSYSIAQLSQCSVEYTIKLPKALGSSVNDTGFSVGCFASQIFNIAFT